MADRFWPGADPVGERIQMGGEPLTIVGVVPDVRVSRLKEAPRPQVYAPYTARRTAGLTLMVRTAGEPAALAPSVRRIVRELDPGVPVSDVHSMDEVKQISLWQQRLFGGLFTSFALIALLLAISGVYGVISYGVSQRTHEIGVRMALGAGVGRVLSLVLQQGAGMAAVGAGVGLVAALGVARLLTSQLYGVTATDPLTFGLAAALLIGTALLASYLPARRAARVDPMVALRAE
jgi:ABC-type antimicrobial peptide transport system permease subunit